MTLRHYKLAIENLLNPKKSKKTQIVIAFHINHWKRDFLQQWFKDKIFQFVPFNLSVEQSKRQFKKILKKPNVEVLVWGMHLPNWVLSVTNKIVYVEDGFIRSIRLGSEHSLPMSLNFDSKTPYFNSQKASDLEDLLNFYDFSTNPTLMQRADYVKQKLLANGISKYNHCAVESVQYIYGVKKQKRILVLGQVEGDASIQYGSNIQYTNYELLMIALLENPQAQIIYKPHPDVLHKKREKLSSPEDLSHLCLVLNEDISLSAAFEGVDHVYTITSQTGFEALIRGIRVTTLGCPFYAGWGLTDNRQSNPRRKRVLTVLEMIAAVFILYPSYYDPIYKIPLEVEDVLQRLIILKQFSNKKQIYLQQQNQQ